MFSLNYFLARLFWEVGYRTEKENVDIYFREVWGNNLEIVSPTFFKMYRRSSKFMCVEFDMLLDGFSTVDWRYCFLSMLTLNFYVITKMKINCLTPSL